MLIVGLGNPGKKYEKTRHNAGFFVADALSSSMPPFREKFSGLFTRGSIAGREVSILKPTTFMNLSGESVRAAATFLKVDAPDIVVVHDELDVPFGDVRIKVGGGHAGHNGLRSIIQHLSADFIRVRFGIGRPPAGYRAEVADWVLSEFDGVERAEVSAVVQRATAAVQDVVRLGALAAQNTWNTRPAAKTS